MWREHDTHPAVIRAEVYREARRAPCSTSRAAIKDGGDSIAHKGFRLTEGAPCDGATHERWWPVEIASVCFELHYEMERVERPATWQPIRAMEESFIAANVSRPLCGLDALLAASASVDLVRRHGRSRQCVHFYVRQPALRRANTDRVHRVVLL